MTANTRSLFTGAMALVLSAIVAGNANACCGATTTAYYAPTATTSFYAPAATATVVPVYTTNYSGGWYPGYWADRVRTRMWGSPNTYVASFAPSTCSSCQQTNFVAGYAPVSAWPSSCSSCASASPCSTCASYAPSTCSTCTAGYAPASSCGCGSSCGCSTCESGTGCSSCSGSTVAQASYQPEQPSCGCSGASNIQPATTYANTQPPTTYVPPVAQPQSQPTVAPQQPYTPLTPTPDPRPTVDLNQQAPAQGATTTQRPIESATTPPPAQPSQPAPPASNSPRPEYDPKKIDNSTFNEAPKLFDPQDRTAQRNIAPVHNALYKQPALYRQVSTARTVVTAEQAQKDAIGWSSVSK